MVGRPVHALDDNSFTLQMECFALSSINDGDILVVATDSYGTEQLLDTSVVTKGRRQMSASTSVMTSTDYKIVIRQKEDITVDESTKPLMTFSFRWEMHTLCFKPGFAYLLTQLVQTCHITGKLCTLEEYLDKFKSQEAKCREKSTGKIRARTHGTISPSRSDALRFIDSAKSPSTKIDGSLLIFRRRLSNRHGRPRMTLTMDIWKKTDRTVSTSTWFAQAGSSVLMEIGLIAGSAVHSWKRIRHATTKKKMTLPLPESAGTHETGHVRTLSVFLPKALQQSYGCIESQYINCLYAGCGK